MVRILQYRTIDEQRVANARYNREYRIRKSTTQRRTPRTLEEKRAATRERQRLFRASRHERDSLQISSTNVLPESASPDNQLSINILEDLAPASEALASHLDVEPMSPIDDEVSVDVSIDSLPLSETQSIEAIEHVMQDEEACELAEAGRDSPVAIHHDFEDEFEEMESAVCKGSEQTMTSPKSHLDGAYDDEETTDGDSLSGIHRSYDIEIDEPIQETSAPFARCDIHVPLREDTHLSDGELPRPSASTLGTSVEPRSRSNTGSTPADTYDRLGGDNEVRRSTAFSYCTEISEQRLTSKHISDPLDDDNFAGYESQGEPFGCDVDMSEPARSSPAYSRSESEEVSEVGSDIDENQNEQELVGSAIDLGRATRSEIDESAQEVLDTSSEVEDNGSMEAEDSCDERQDLEAKEEVVQRFVQHFDTFTGCDETSHSEHTSQHDHHTSCCRPKEILRSVRDMRVPNVLGSPFQPEKGPSADRASAEANSYIYCGLKNSEPEPPRICLSKEPRATSKCSTTFDVDSVLGDVSSLACAKMGIQLYTTQASLGFLKGSLHLRTRPVYFVDSAGRTRSIKLALGNMPQYMLGRVQGFDDLTIHLLFPHLYREVQSCPRLTDLDFETFMDCILLPSLRETYPSSEIQHFPRSWRHALSIGLARSQEQPRKTFTARQVPHIIFLAPEKLQELWNSMLEKISADHFSGFREMSLFINGKGLKAKFRAPNLPASIRLFRQTWDHVIDSSFLLSSCYLDIGKEVINDSNQPITFLWRPCCLESFSNSISATSKHPEIKKKVYLGGQLQDAISMTIEPTMSSRARQGGHIYSQCYNQIKVLWMSLGRRVFESDSLETLALDPGAIRALMHSAGAYGQKRYTTLLKSYNASKNRIFRALDGVETQKFGVREEHRLRFDVVWSIVDRTPCSETHHASEKKPYFELLTAEIAGWHEYNFNKFCLGFETSFLSHQGSIVTWEQSQIMLMFLKLLRFTYGAHRLEESRSIWRDYITIPNVDSEKRVDGLGLEKTITRYGYGWMLDKIDWHTWQFHDSYRYTTDFDSHILQSSFSRRAATAKQSMSDYVLLSRMPSLLKRFKETISPRQLLLKYLQDICLRSFRRCVFQTSEPYLKPEFRQEAMEGHLMLCPATMEQVFKAEYRYTSILSASCYIKSPNDIFQKLWSTRDGVTRIGWDTKSYRTLYDKCYKMVKYEYGKNAGHNWRKHLRAYWCCSTWVSPYPTNSKFLSKDKAGDPRWWYNHHSDLQTLIDEAPTTVSRAASLPPGGWKRSQSVNEVLRQLLVHDNDTAGQTLEELLSSLLDASESDQQDSAGTIPSLIEPTVESVIHPPELTLIPKAATDAQIHQLMRTRHIDHFDVDIQRRFKRLKRLLSTSVSIRRRKLDIETRLMRCDGIIAEAELISERDPNDEDVTSDEEVFNIQRMSFAQEFRKEALSLTTLIEADKEAQELQKVRRAIGPWDEWVERENYERLMRRLPPVKIGNSGAMIRPITSQQPQCVQQTCAASMNSPQWLMTSLDSPMSDLGPFRHYENFRILVCRDCGDAVRPIDVPKHLQGEHLDLGPVYRDRIRERISSLGLRRLKSKRAFDQLFLHLLGIEERAPISDIKLQSDGFECTYPDPEELCRRVFPNEKAIRTHMERAHGWRFTENSAPMPHNRNVFFQRPYPGQLYWSFAIRVFPAANDPALPSIAPPLAWLDPLHWNTSVLIITCPACGVVVLPDSVEVHLQLRHPDVDSTRRSLLVSRVKYLPVHQSLAQERRHFQNVRVAGAVPQLEGLELFWGAYRCRAISCGFISKELSEIREHVHLCHTNLRTIEDTTSRHRNPTVYWSTNIPVQTLAIRHNAKELIQVTPNADAMTAHIMVESPPVEPPPCDPDTLIDAEPPLIAERFWGPIHSIQSLRTLVCNACGIALETAQLGEHLEQVHPKVHQPRYLAERLEPLCLRAFDSETDIQEVMALVNSRTSAAPLPGLKLFDGGYECWTYSEDSICGSIFASLSKMRDHALSVHNWNEPSQGEDHDNNQDEQPVEPWRYPVVYQRFFSCGRWRNSLFRVDRPPNSSEDHRGRFQARTYAHVEHDFVDGSAETESGQRYIISPRLRLIICTYCEIAFPVNRIRYHSTRSHGDSADMVKNTIYTAQRWTPRPHNTWEDFKNNTGIPPPMGPPIPDLPIHSTGVRCNFENCGKLSLCEVTMRKHCKTHPGLWQSTPGRVGVVLENTAQTFHGWTENIVCQQLIMRGEGSEVFEVTVEGS